jgi:hypothetical protein
VGAGQEERENPRVEELVGTIAEQEPPVDMCTSSGDAAGGSENAGEVESRESGALLMHACERKEDSAGGNLLKHARSESGRENCQRKSSESVDDFNPWCASTRIVRVTG